jgi:hypothetical protein
MGRVYQLEEENDFDDYYEQDQNRFFQVQSEPTQEKSNYRSHLFCAFTALFIILFFSAFCLEKIDKVGEKMNISFFNDKNEPNWLLLLVQFLILFFLIKMISKY